MTMVAAIKNKTSKRQQIASSGPATNPPDLWNDNKELKDLSRTRIYRRGAAAGAAIDGAAYIVATNDHWQRK